MFKSATEDHELKAQFDRLELQTHTQEEEQMAVAATDLLQKTLAKARGTSLRHKSRRKETDWSKWGVTTQRDFIELFCNVEVRLLIAGGDAERRLAIAFLRRRDAHILAAATYGWPFADEMLEEGWHGLETARDVERGHSTWLRQEAALQKKIDDEAKARAEAHDLEAAEKQKKGKGTAQNAASSSSPRQNRSGLTRGETTAGYKGSAKEKAAGKAAAAAKDKEGTGSPSSSTDSTTGGSPK
jgi:hypothetical protein